MRNPLTPPCNLNKPSIPANHASGRTICSLDCPIIPFVPPSWRDPLRDPYDLSFHFDIPLFDTKSYLRYAPNYCLHSSQISYN